MLFYVNIQRGDGVGSATKVAVGGLPKSCRKRSSPKKNPTSQVWFQLRRLPSRLLKSWRRGRMARYSERSSTSDLPEKRYHWWPGRTRGDGFDRLSRPVP